MGIKGNIQRVLNLASWILTQINKSKSKGKVRIKTIGFNIAGNKICTKENLK